MALPTITASETCSTEVLAFLPDYTDVCGCSLFGGRCERHGAMMTEIHHATFHGTETAFQVICTLADGFGPGGLLDMEFDWSGVRDSSTAAIEAIHQALHA